MEKLKRFTAGAVVSAMVLANSGAVLLSDAKNILTMSAAAATTVNNPVIWADVPDVDIIRVGDTYYTVSTTMFFSPGAPIMKSKDLVSWEICNYVYDTLADGDVQTLKNDKHDYSHGQWAASLRYHDGKFYVFFGSYGTNKSYIYSTDDIENGKWSCSAVNGMYHDASILFDDDGRNYLVYGGNGEIKIKEFNEQMTDFKWGGVDKTLFKTGLDGLAGEGSHVQKIGDYYYVFVIAWPSGHPRIELCYRSKSLLGNYEGKTVLESGVGSYGSGVAQGGIVDTPDGKWYGLLFQDHGSVGRIPVLVPVTWQNDWPVMGVNGKAPISFTVDGDATGAVVARDDDFSYTENKLKLEWQWNHNPDNKSWSVTEREGWLRLHNNNMATNIMNARNTLTMRTVGPACSSVIKLDTKGMKAGDHAGLSAFQFNYGNIGVYVTDSGQKKVYMSKNGGYSGNANIKDSYDKKVAEENLDGDTVYLKADFKFSDVKSDMSASNDIDKVNFYYSYDGTNWKKLGDEIKMTYDLKVFTGYRSAIYSYPTKSTGGYADIDSFDFECTPWNYVEIIEPDENGYYFRSSFEGSTDKWEGRGSAKITSTDKTASDGSSSAYVSDREASWNGITQHLNSAFKGGESYSFSADVMYDEGETDSQTFFLTLQYEDSTGETHYDKVDTAVVTKGKWLQLSDESFKIPDGAVNLWLYVETEEGSDSFYVDNLIGAVDGVKITSAGSEPEINVTPGDINSDGAVDVFDLIMARSGLIGGFDDKTAEKAADVDNSGKVEINDLVLIQSYLLGKTSDFTIN